MEKRGIEAYIAELIGTFALVFFIGVVLAVYQDPGAVDPTSATVAKTFGVGYRDFTVVGLTHAFVLFMLVISLGSVSGGHFNPAVTSAMALIRKIAPADAAVYIVFQLAGGVLGSLLVKAILSDEGKAVNYGATGVSDALGGKAGLGFLVEALGTFFLMWAIMGVAVNKKAPKEWAGLVIGTTLGFLVLVFAPLTGAGFNPARWFGPALVSGEWANAWIYIVGPIVGAAVAALSYGALVLRGQQQET